MLEFAREHIVGLAIAAVLHLVLLAVLIVGLPRRATVPEAASRPPVPAVAVSESDLQAVQQRQEVAREAEVRRQREEAARQQAEAERQREAEIRLQREREEAEQRARAQAEQRATEERRQAEEARRAEEARKAEAARKAEEERKAEQARREAEARERAEAEARRKAEEAARAEAARQAAEARAQAQMQEQLAAQIESEQRRMRLQESAEYVAWIGAIQDQVTRHWNRPPSARSGLECEVRVGLIPGMQVVNAEILRCNGDDVVRRSIIAAVERASPLPRPSDPALFERSIVFVFKPQD